MYRIILWILNECNTESPPDVSWTHEQTLAPASAEAARPPGRKARLQLRANVACRRRRPPRCECARARHRAAVGRTGARTGRLPHRHRSLAPASGPGGATGRIAAHAADAHLR